MKKLYLLTGANGHLGHTIRNYLSGDVREWIHHKDDRWPNAYVGDVCDKKALEPFFDREGYDEVVLIHCAAKKDIHCHQTRSQCVGNQCMGYPKYLGSGQRTCHRSDDLYWFGPCHTRKSRHHDRTFDF